MGYVLPMGNDPVSLPMIPSIHPSPPLSQLERALAEKHSEVQRLLDFVRALTGRGLAILMEAEARADDRGGAGSDGDGSGC